MGVDAEGKREEERGEVETPTGHNQQELYRYILLIHLL